MMAASTLRRGRLPVAARSLADGWRGLLGWLLGMAAAIFLYLPLFPSMQTPELQGMLDGLPPELVQTLGYEDITSGAGYVQATFFGLIGFTLLTIAAVGWGSAAIAGAEESGRLELTLAHAVGRVPFALESALAVLVRLLVIGAAVFGMIWTVNESAQLELGAMNLVAGISAWLGLGMLSASVALAIGGVTGRRSWSIGGGAGIAVLAYGLQAVAGNSEDLEWLDPLSPFTWAYGEAPLLNGFDGVGLALLWGVSALLVAVATIALSRRDVLG